MIGSRADIDASDLAAGRRRGVGARRAPGRARGAGLPRWALAERIEWTPARAVRAIAAVTLLVTLASGGLMCVVDRREFPNLGRGLWWAAQTVTTVGYGDVVPHATPGRMVAVVVMLSALAFLTVVTAAITATLLEATHHRLQERAPNSRHSRPEDS